MEFSPGMSIDKVFEFGILLKTAAVTLLFWGEVFVEYTRTSVLFFS